MIKKIVEKVNKTKVARITKRSKVKVSDFRKPDVIRSGAGA